MACIPAAAASSETQAALENELRAALGQSDAVELAIEAARSAPTPDAAFDAFVEAYVRATGDTDAAQVLGQLLQDHPNRFGAPALPLNRAVWTAASSAPQLLHRAADAVLTHAPAVERTTPAVATVPEDRSAQPPLRTLCTQQPRAP